MKSTELRIGNLVYHDEFVCEITSINPSEASYGLLEDVDGYDRNGFWNAEWFKPIPLTEEWLVKFGFDKNGLYWYDSNDNILSYSFIKNTIAIDSMGIYIMDKIKHVHQLQNLYFALAEKELELKQ